MFFTFKILNVQLHEFGMHNKLKHMYRNAILGRGCKCYYISNGRGCKCQYMSNGRGCKCHITQKLILIQVKRDYKRYKTLLQNTTAFLDLKLRQLVKLEKISLISPICLVV